MSDDRVIAEIAEFMAEHGHKSDPPVVLAQIVERWPGATGRQIKAAMEMAYEAKLEETLSYQAQAEQMGRYLEVVQPVLEANPGWTLEQAEDHLRAQGIDIPEAPARIRDNRG